MKVVKVGPGRYLFKFWGGGIHIRKVYSLAELARLMSSGPTAESNLGASHEPVAFGSFAEETYLPMDAKLRLKDTSFRREADAVKALVRHFGDTPLHKVSRQGWVEYQNGRLSGKLSARGKPSSPSGLLKEFKCLRSALAYAESEGYIRRNVLANIKPGRQLGLFDQRRADVWLTREEVWRVFDYVPPQLRLLFEFMVWTGARPEEACRFGRSNIGADGKTIWVANIKKRKANPSGVRKKTFRVSTLGPRFGELLKSLVPHPETGLFFCNPATGRRYVARYLQQAFKKAVERAGLGRRVVPYDLRGTFAMHRAMVVRTFGQLRAEMGHVDAKSIQSYLDDASHCDPKESIFYGVDASWSAPSE